MKTARANLGLIVGLTLVLTVQALAQDKAKPSQEEAIAAIEKLWGRVTVKPVFSVDLELGVFIRHERHDNGA